MPALGYNAYDVIRTPAELRRWLGCGEERVAEILDEHPHLRRRLGRGRPGVLVCDLARVLGLGLEEETTPTQEQEVGGMPLFKRKEAS